MKIEHIAIWSNDIEKLKNFYIKYFSVKCNHKYKNQKRNFESYFLSFGSGSRIEIMQISNLGKHPFSEKHFVGFAHIAISVGSKEKVDEITAKIKEDGHKVISEPRTTGDGYYESVVEDTDGNKVEITI